MSEQEKDVKTKANEIVEKVKDLVKKGNVSRIFVKRNDEVILNLPLNAGIATGVVGVFAAPWALLAAAITTIGFDCKVEIQKTDGTLVDISGKTVAKKIKNAIDEE